MSDVKKEPPVVPSNPGEDYWSDPANQEYLKEVLKEAEESKPAPLPELDSGFGFL